MAIKIINDGSAAILRLEKDHNEHLLFDFFRIGNIICDGIEREGRPITKTSVSMYFTDNEYDVIREYFNGKTSLNEFPIEDLIDLEDAIDVYLFEVFCKNLEN